MLIILYCKPEEKQGKKRFVRRLRDEFGVRPVKKYTSKSEVDDNDNRDENLYYSLKNPGVNIAIDTTSEFVNKIIETDLTRQMNESKSEEMIRNYKEKDFFIYARPKNNNFGGLWYYAIKKSDIEKAVASKSENYVVVCTNIDIIGEIYKETKENMKRNIHIYCLRRKKYNDVSLNKPIFQITVADIREFLCNENATSKFLNGCPSHAKISVLPFGEERELDFFRNISFFNGLLIVEEHPEMDNNPTNYEKNVDEIITKYIGLVKTTTRKVVVIHSMGPKKFVINFKTKSKRIVSSFPSITDKQMQQQFEKMIRAIYFQEVSTGSVELIFANEIQNQGDGKGSFELTEAILDTISSAQVVIGDFRNLNHNCIYETGYAKGMGKQVYILALEEEKEEMRKLLFDVITNKVEYYDFHKLMESTYCMSLLQMLRMRFGIQSPSKEKNNELIIAVCDINRTEKDVVFYPRMDKPCD
jgi:nucleoside 2-deoxyribosyltransferase